MWYQLNLQLDDVPDCVAQKNVASLKKGCIKNY